MRGRLSEREDVGTITPPKEKPTRGKETMKVGKEKSHKKTKNLEKRENPKIKTTKKRAVTQKNFP